MSLDSLAPLIDHSVLKPEATAQDVVNGVLEAEEFGCAAICVCSCRVQLAVATRTESTLRVATVIGFPSGAFSGASKASEAAEAVDNGADELDVVMNIGFFLDGDTESVAADLEAVRAASEDRVLKVILETALLSDDQIAAACRLAVGAGADFVKTSTGFHPSGGASVQAVALMREVFGPDVGVKASGGIRSAADALAMVEAGATRIGTSSTRSMLV